MHPCIYIYTYKYILEQTLGRSAVHALRGHRRLPDQHSDSRGPSLRISGASRLDARNRSKCCFRISFGTPFGLKDAAFVLCLERRQVAYVLAAVDSSLLQLGEVSAVCITALLLIVCRIVLASNVLALLRPAHVWLNLVDVNGRLAKGLMGLCCILVGSALPTSSMPPALLTGAARDRKHGGKEMCKSD